MGYSRLNLARKFGPAAETQRLSRDRARMDQAQKDWQYLANKRPPLVNQGEASVDFEALTKMIKAIMPEEAVKAEAKKQAADASAGPALPRITPQEEQRRAHAQNIERLDRILNGRGRRPKPF